MKRNFSISLNVRLRELRSKKTQLEIAKELGVNQQTYANWELGNRQPKLQDLTSIAFHFGVTTDWLLGLENNSQSIDFPDHRLNTKIMSLKKTATEAAISIDQLLDSIKKLEDVL